MELEALRPKLGGEVTPGKAAAKIINDRAINISESVMEKSHLEILLNTFATQCGNSRFYLAAIYSILREIDFDNI